MLGAITPRIEHTSAIVITETFRLSGLRENFKHVQHSSQNSIELIRDLQLVTNCELARVQEEIKGIHMIVKGLFEMEAIGSNLTFGLFDDCAPAVIPPVRSGWELRTERANEKQRNCLAEQMRVRREIS